MPAVESEMAVDATKEGVASGSDQDGKLSEGRRVRLDQRTQMKIK